MRNDLRGGYAPFVCSLVISSILCVPCFSFFSTLRICRLDCTYYKRRLPRCTNGIGIHIVHIVTFERDNNNNVTAGKMLEVRWIPLSGASYLVCIVF
jgi:hypothetical protein